MKNRAIMGLGLLLMIICLCPAMADETADPTVLAREILSQKGLDAQAIAVEDIAGGREPKGFFLRTGAQYRPSYNPEPSIPPQCWIETGYGTQNACLYCHTNYLAENNHGNAFPLGEDQVLYSFPEPELNRILWRNLLFPDEIVQRLKHEGIELPDPEDVDYVRKDNWGPAWNKARPRRSAEWLNRENKEFVLFPALNPQHLYPFRQVDPTSRGTHGFIDEEGFVRDERKAYTGWRAINFFPYGIFTPISGSVSGIYIRLPERFRNVRGRFDAQTYRKNLELLEKNIKNRSFNEIHYYGDAKSEAVVKGFYPVGTEFAHPLHYVDLKADGESGNRLDGVTANSGFAYEFPGTRAKRLKEMRYMYKYKEIGLEDIDEDAHFEDFVVGHEGQGWVDNNAGWLLSGFIEDRRGNLRSQTTEELMQCMGCHGKVGNTVDSVWSFQRKLPGDEGWGEMDYGAYDSRNPGRSALKDYVHENSGKGELGFFLHVVAGADLYGVMPGEIAAELRLFAVGQRHSLYLDNRIVDIFDDERLKDMESEERRSHLLDRQKIMRAYVATLGYLHQDHLQQNLFIKGSLLYPSQQTAKNNIALYRKIVLDQSFNLGKDVFGTEPDNVPFTFRSDGTVLNEDRELIPAGDIITSRPFGEDGVGVTPTGIVAVNGEGNPIDSDGNEVDIETHPEKAQGHISTGGTFDTMYNPILSDVPLR